MATPVGKPGRPCLRLGAPRPSRQGPSPGVPSISVLGLQCSPPPPAPLTKSLSKPNSPREGHPNPCCGQSPCSCHTLSSLGDKGSASGGWSCVHQDSGQCSMSISEQPGESWSFSGPRATPRHPSCCWVTSLPGLSPVPTPSMPFSAPRPDLRPRGQGKLWPAV